MMQETQTGKRRFLKTIVVILLLLISVAVVGTLFTQSLTTADQRHDHDGDGAADH